MEVSRYVENLKTKFVNIDDKKELLEEITKQLAPKEMEKKLLGEVFTPLDLVEKMLDTLNKEKEVWTNPDLKWLEPGSGIGNFSICVFYRLMDGLKTAIPDSAKRERHIIENMLYMAELNPANVHICKSVFKAKKNGYKLNIYEGDFIELFTELKPNENWPVNWPKQFDIIFGNPPYNKPSIKDTSESPLYNEFIENSIPLTKKYLLYITPSRWFITGKGLDQFRKSMLSRKDIKLIHHYEDSRTIWPNVDIKGGVNYFLIDKSYRGLCNFNGHNIDISKYDILVSNKKYYSIIDKVSKYTKLSDIYINTSYFGIKTNFEHYTNNQSLIKCYVSKQKGFEKYVDIKYIKNRFDFWKVITPTAAGKGYDGFGDIFFGTPNEIHSQSYISFKVNSELEAKSLESYLKSNLANFMLSIRKISQHISENTISWIPLVPLDREWSDIEIYNYFGLTKDEIIEIEKTLDSRARHHSTLEELSLFSTSHTTYSNVVKTPAKKLIRVDKLKQSAGYSQSTSIKQQKTDKLQYILQNIHKIDIKYKIFEKKLIELGVNIDYIPKLWNKYYLQLKN